MMHSILFFFFFLTHSCHFLFCFLFFVLFFLDNAACKDIMTRHAAEYQTFEQSYTESEKIEEKVELADV